MQVSKRCPYWDCGWCYHPDGTNTGCIGSDQCDIYADTIATDNDEVIDDDKE
jgi:hypothetical protein